MGALVRYFRSSEQILFSFDGMKEVQNSNLTK